MNANLFSRFVISVFLSAIPVASGITFQVSAPISLVYGPGADAISNIVAVGMVCTGTISYNPGSASPDSDPSPNNAIYSLNATDMQMSVRVGTNVFSSSDSSSCNIRVDYQSSSPVSDGLHYEINGALLNGGPVPGATESQTLDVALSTTNLQALASDALPVLAPQLTSFPYGGGNGFVEIVFYTYKSGSFDYGFSGTLASITPVPALSSQLAAGQIQLSWPTNAFGFQLEMTPTPNLPGSWSNVTSQPTIQNDLFQVSVPTGLSSRFFRLRSVVSATVAR